MEKIQTNLFETAKKRMDNLTFSAKTLDELEKIMATQPGFVIAPWCGSTECELKVKEIRGTKSRCILDDNVGDTDSCICCGKKAKHNVLWGIQY
jgi:prolyl-tRNA synthetase